MHALVFADHWHVLDDAGASCFALRRDTRSLCTFSLKVGLELVSLGALPR